jgi:amidase
MTTIREYTFMDAVSLAEMVRKKEVKPLELVETAIEMVEQLNPKLNAVITRMFDMAIKEAKGDIPDGPFKGVPFLLKDICAEHAGVRHTEGSDFLGEYVSPHHSELVNRFKKSGVIIIGVTNTPEFGLHATTEPRRFGPARNPWNILHSTGGSSGGSAAAVSSGMVPMAHANDGGGSIRIPASCCGIFGLKPTRGRNPLGPDLGEFWAGMVCEHVVARSVRDSAAMLDATSGPDAGAPYYAAPPSRPFSQEVGTEPGKLKFGFTIKSPTGRPVHEDCIAAVRETALLLEGLGHDVEEVALDDTYIQAAESFNVVITASLAWEIAVWSRKIGKVATEKDLEPATWALLEIGKQHSAANYVDAINNIHNFSRNFASHFTRCDILVTPTLAEPPIRLGFLGSTEDDPLSGFKRLTAYIPFTPIGNMTGQPAMSVPLFWNNENLPIGVQFMGRYGDEATLFRLASQLENAKPWAKRRPSIGI